MEINQKKNEIERFRPVWNFERKFVKSPVANVSIVAQVRGKIDSDLFKIAIGKLKEIHPLITSHIVTDSDLQSYFQFDKTIEIPLEIITRESESCWFEVLQKAHKQPFDFENGPLIRFYLIKNPNPNEISEIIVLCQHTICDGTALANILRDLLTYYANPDLILEIVNPPRSLDTIFPSINNSNNFISKLKKKIIHIYNKKWHVNPFLFTYQEYLEIHREYWSRKSYKFVSMELDEKTTSLLSTKCHNHGITINSVLIMAFIRAYYDIKNTFTKNTLVIPYDLRKRVEKKYENVFCLFINSLEISFKKLLKMEFWQAAAKLNELIKQKIEARDMFQIILDIQNLDGSILDTLGLMIQAKYISKDSSSYNRIQNFLNDKKNLANIFAKKFDSAMPDVIMTNLGKLNFSKIFGDLQLENMYFTPSAAEMIPLQLGAVGVAGKLTLTINYIIDKNAPESDNTLFYSEVRNKAMSYLGLI